MIDDDQTQTYQSATMALVATKGSALSQLASMDS
jgi:hypothetical protein